MFYVVDQEKLEKLKTDFTVAQVCCGSGGAGKGFQDALTEFHGKVGTFENLYGIDVSPLCCEDFTNLTGKPAYCLDLFDREQYVDWHGQEPPADWKEITPDDIRALSDGKSPDVVFFSAPCKGFSGLLPKRESESKKYQAMNKLYWRVMWLFLEAFPDDPPALIISENVPRIKQRGLKWIKKVRDFIKKNGFAYHNDDHCLGEMGGLAQKRLRNKLVARNPEKCQVELFHPKKQPYKTIGDVIGPLPLPGDTLNGGPMHRLPRLKWKVWMRLAMIPAGGDWRDLEKIVHTKYSLSHYARNGAWGVEDWYSTPGAVTGGAGVGRSNGLQAISDVRFGCNENRHASHYRVEPFGGVSGTVTGASHVGNGRICISDTRMKKRDSRHPGVNQVVREDEVSPCVTGTRFGSGALAVADTRTLSRGYSNKHKVLTWTGQATTVTGTPDILSGAQSISDPRVTSGTHSRPDDYGVMEWNQTAKTIRGAGRIMNSASSISDPRIGCRPRSGTYGVMGMNETASTIIGSADIHCSASAVADDRDLWNEHQIEELIWFDCRPKFITTHFKRKAEKRRFVDTQFRWEDILGADMTKGNIRRILATLRRDNYLGPLAASLKVAMQHVYERAEAGYFRVPDDEESGVWIILSPHDGAWHRPLTTYELAAIQSFPLFFDDGTPFCLSGENDASWRERIGNAVPPKAAQAIAQSMLFTLMVSQVTDFVMGATEKVWVQEEDRSEDQASNPPTEQHKELVYVH